MEHMDAKGHSHDSIVRVKKASAVEGHHTMSRFSGSRRSSVDTTNTGNHHYRMTGHLKLENTFKLGPDDAKRYYAYKLHPNISELIAEKMALCEKTNQSGYNPRACTALTRELADNIRREAKNFNVPRLIKKQERESTLFELYLIQKWKKEHSKIMNII